VIAFPCPGLVARRSGSGRLSRSAPDGDGRGKRPDRLAVGRVAATWWLPTVIACAVGALYVCYSVAQWRALVAPSWDLGIFAEAVQAYSRFEAPIVPIKGPGYNLLGDHFHPILALLGPVYRLFPSALTLLVVQDVLIAVSVLPAAPLAQRLLGRGQGHTEDLGEALGTGRSCRTSPAFRWAMCP